MKTSIFIPRITEEEYDQLFNDAYLHTKLITIEKQELSIFARDLKLAEIDENIKQLRCA
jgi:hypothetical protein